MSELIEIILNDRFGKKIKIKVHEDDTIKDVKILVASKTGTKADKIRIQRGNQIYQDNISLDTYEIVNGMSLDIYYN